MVKTGLVLTLSLVIAPAALGSYRHTGLQHLSDGGGSDPRGDYGAGDRKRVPAVFLYGLRGRRFDGYGVRTVHGQGHGSGGRCPDRYLRTVYQCVLFLYFFATGCHLLTVKLFAYTYEVIPVGAARLVTQDIAWYLVSIFGSVFLMVIKLALPFVAAEFVLEVSMGVLMKLIPQIHVFVINIQSKILLGILLMMLFARPIGAFIDSYYG